MGVTGEEGQVSKSDTGAGNPREKSGEPLSHPVIKILAAHQEKLKSIFGEAARRDLEDQEKNTDTTSSSDPDLFQLVPELVLEVMGTDYQLTESDILNIWTYGRDNLDFGLLPGVMAKNMLNRQAQLRSSLARLIAVKTLIHGYSDISDRLIGTFLRTASGVKKYENKEQMGGALRYMAGKAGEPGSIVNVIDGMTDKVKKKLVPEEQMPIFGTAADSFSNGFGPLRLYMDAFFINKAFPPTNSTS